MVDLEVSMIMRMHGGGFRNDGLLHSDNARTKNGYSS
jgi:hypothetical protein